MSQAIAAQYGNIETMHYFLSLPGLLHVHRQYALEIISSLKCTKSIWLYLKFHAVPETLLFINLKSGPHIRIINIIIRLHAAEMMILIFVSCETYISSYILSISLLADKATKY